MEKQILNEGAEDFSIKDLTLNMLLQNPTGKGSAFLGSRKTMIDDLNNRFLKLISEVKVFPFSVYKVKNDYIFHFIIPSETNKLLQYDVVIQFLGEKEVKDDLSLQRYTLRLFSNAPSFMFTYTYVMNHEDALCELLKSKCSKKALTEEPKQRNPIGVFGFEKSIYYACIFIKKFGLFNKSTIDPILKSFNKELFLASISSQESKLIEYSDMKKIKESKPKKKTSSIRSDFTVVIQTHCLYMCWRTKTSLRLNPRMWCSQRPSLKRR